MPTAQCEQAVAPTTEEKVPAAHALQLVDADAPVVVRYVPAGQLVHVVRPASPAYLPAAQFSHASFVPAVGATVPTAHTTQLVDAAAPVVVR